MLESIAFTQKSALPQPTRQSTLPLKSVFIPVNRLQNDIRANVDVAFLKTLYHEEEDIDDSNSNDDNSN